MTTRRRFIATTAIVSTGVAVAGYALNSRNARVEYEDAVRRTWRHSQGEPDSSRARLLELVRYATLAPSSHNTQCWQFRVGEETVAILPDYRRRCPVVDPDDHHLFVSLGCAAENLIQAASARGYRAAASFEAGPTESLNIALQSARPIPSPLYEAIPLRQSSRCEFDGKALSAQELRQLEAAGNGTGVTVRLLSERPAVDAVLDFVLQGKTAQMRDRAFVRELKHWIRFDGAQAARTGDGLFAGASGNPSVPPWLGGLMFDLFFQEEAENDKYARQIRSAAGIAVFVSDEDDKAHWIEAGRSFQRFALQAAALGICTAHVNQPVEVPSIRPQFASFLGMTSGRPDLVVRFGRGPQMPRSVRRPLEAVLL
jgi:hypothetical protein